MFLHGIWSGMPCNGILTTSSYHSFNHPVLIGIHSLFWFHLVTHVKFIYTNQPKTSFTDQQKELCDSSHLQIFLYRQCSHMNSHMSLFCVERVERKVNYDIFHIWFDFLRREQFKQNVTVINSTLSVICWGSHCTQLIGSTN